MPDLDAPTTQVDSVDASTATLVVRWSGSDSGGSGLKSFELYVQVDAAGPRPVGTFIVGGAGSTSYQAIADGASHSYRFYTIGRDVAGNVEPAPAPASADVAVSASFAPPAALAVTSFSVQKGAAGRSFIRYLDLAFNRGSELQAFVASVNDADPTNDRLKLTRYDLSGAAGSGATVSLASRLAAVDAALEFDFGSRGITGDGGSTAGDGYYILQVDLDGDGTYDVDRRFYRLLGDVDGDREVTASDVAAIDQALRSGLLVPGLDVNGDGVLNTADRALVVRSKGRKLGSALRLDA